MSALKRGTTRLVATSMPIGNVRDTIDISLSVWAAPRNKKSRNKKVKKITKRNLPNVGMGGWMHGGTG